MEITITKPKMEHGEAIATVCSTGWKQTVEGLLSEEFILKNIHSWYNTERVRRDILNTTYTHIAIAQSKVIGVIGGGMTAPTVGEVFVLYVDEAFRYQGIGRQLLQALTKEQIALGAKEQWVSVQEHNHLGIPFYEARGFIFQHKKITVTETNEEQVSLRYMRHIK